MDEKTKNELLEELRKDYQVTIKPLAESKFSVSDIIDKYWDRFRNIANNPNDRLWNHNKEAFGMAVRRVVCIKYGVWKTQDIPFDKRKQYREDLEKFIVEYLLSNK